MTITPQEFDDLRALSVRSGGRADLTFTHARATGRAAEIVIRWRAEERASWSPNGFQAAYLQALGEPVSYDERLDTFFAPVEARERLTGARR